MILWKVKSWPHKNSSWPYKKQKVNHLQSQIDHIKSKMGHRNTEGILTGLASHNISNCFEPFLFFSSFWENKGKSHLKLYFNFTQQGCIYPPSASHQQVFNSTIFSFLSMNLFYVCIVSSYNFHKLCKTKEIWPVVRVREIYSSTFNST